MRKLFLLIFSVVLIFQNAVYSSESSEKTIWDYTRDDFVNNALLGGREDGFFEQKKQEKIDKELERLLNVKLVPVSLEDCLTLAIENNFKIKSKKSTERENYWYKKNAYTEFLPDITYKFSLQRLSGSYLVGGIVPDHVDETPIQSYFLFDWSAFERGRAFFDVSKRRSLHKSAILEKNFTRDEVILNTAKSYYELLKNKANVDIYATNVIDRKAQYDLTMARFHSGVGTKFDIYRAEGELAKAKQKYITAFNVIRTSQAKLANIIGIDVLTPLYPKEIIIRQKNLSDIETEKLIEWSTKTRKDYLSQKKKIDAMKAERSSKYTEFIPDVRLSYANARYGTVRAGLYPSNTFTVTLSAPLGNKVLLGTITEIKAQTQAVKAAEYDLIQKARDIQEAIISSKQESASAEERITASKKEVFASGKSLENSIVLMNAGLVTFIDVIQAQELKVSAQVGLAQNITDYNVAQIQILFDSGIITVDNVLNGVKKPLDENR